MALIKRHVSRLHRVQIARQRLLIGTCQNWSEQSASNAGPPTTRVDAKYRKVPMRLLHCFHMGLIRQFSERNRPCESCFSKDCGHLIQAALAFLLRCDVRRPGGSQRATPASPSPMAAHGSPYATQCRARPKNSSRSMRSRLPASGSQSTSYG